jgi:hypothetical protein
LAQQVCRRVAGSRKVAKQKKSPVKEFNSCFFTYDARIFSFRQKDWTVSLTTVEAQTSPANGVVSERKVLYAVPCKP